MHTVYFFLGKRDLRSILNVLVHFLDIINKAKQIDPRQKCQIHKVKTKNFKQKKTSLKSLPRYIYVYMYIYIYIYIYTYMF